MSGVPSSRRDFLRTTSAVAATAGLSLYLPGCREAAESAARAGTGDPPRVLTPEQIRTLEAFSDRILPPDGDAPGATAMGAVVFMDHYLEARPDLRADVTTMVEVVDARVAAAHPGAEGLHALDPDAADAVVRALQEEDPQTFFGLYPLVLFGVFAEPARGGNRDETGWALLGYDDRHAWQPPFGFYDGEAARGGDA